MEYIITIYNKNMMNQILMNFKHTYNKYKKQQLIYHMDIKYIKI